MSRLPYMPMFWSDFFDDPRVKQMSAVEKGIYAILLGAMWVNEGWLPDSDKIIARMLGLDVRSWRSFAKKIRPLLAEMSDPILGRYVTQRRLQIEWEIASEQRAKRTANLGRYAQKRPGKTTKRRHQAGEQKPATDRTTKPVKPIGEPMGIPPSDNPITREKVSALQAEKPSPGSTSQDQALPPREAARLMPAPGLRDIEAELDEGRSDLTKRLVNDGLKRTPSLSDIANMGKRS